MPPGVSGGKSSNIDPGYTGDEYGQSIDSDRRFSNFILFSGALALAILFMESNVLHIKIEKEAKAKATHPAKNLTTYIGKADIGGSWFL